jgi:hypothetical protein
MRVTTVPACTVPDNPPNLEAAVLGLIGAPAMADALALALCGSLMTTVRAVSQDDAELRPEIPEGEQ